MIRKLFSRNSFLQKMLFSIVGLICIPMICIQLFMITRTNREFQQENTASYQQAVQSLALSFDNQLSSISATAYRMQMDTEVTRPMIEDVRGYDLQIVARKIQSYGLDSPLIHSIGVYYHEKNMVLYNTSKHTLQNLCNQFFTAESDGNTALQNFLQNDVATDYFYTGKYSDAAGEFLVVSKSISQNGKEDHTATAFFVIEAKQFKRWCAIFVPNGEGFAIFDKENSHLLGSEELFTPISKKEDFQEFINNNDQAYVPSDSPHVILYKYRALNTGYTYIAAVEKDTAEATFNHYTTQTAQTIVVTVILIAILLAVTLYINYRPVHNIVKKHINPDSRKAKVSEIELINTHLFAQDERITNLNQLLASFVVGDLLSGLGIDTAAAEKHFPSGTYRSFAVALFYKPMTTVQSAEVCRAVTEKGEGKLVVTMVPYREEVVFVYAAEASIDAEQLREMLAEAVHAVTGEKPEIRMGTVVESILEIQSSYNNALLAEQIPSDIDSTLLEGYPHATVVNFEKHVSNAEWSLMLQDLDELERINRELKPTVKRFVHLKVLNGYLTNISKRGYTLSDQSVNQLLAYTNGQHLYSMMRRFTSGLQLQHKAGYEEKVNKLKSKLLDYVNQNFTSRELCLSSAADYLQTSIYTVSRIFKETTGIGFKEYITEKRLQHGCMLLRSSNMAISDIGAACGFDNAEYFTVIFRNKFGMAPSKFRQQAEALAAENEEQK